MIEKSNNQRKVKMKGYGTNYAANMAYPGHILVTSGPQPHRDKSRQLPLLSNSGKFQHAWLTIILRRNWLHITILGICIVKCRSISFNVSNCAGQNLIVMLVHVLNVRLSSYTHSRTYKTVFTTAPWGHIQLIRYKLLLKDYYESVY